MLRGWFEKQTVRKTVKQVMGRVMRNVDLTVKRNPGLTIDEALKMVDRQQGVFFPGEKIDPKDLKSLFALIVWKGYRNIRLSDPEAFSDGHRELVYRMVFDYLRDQKPTSPPLYRRVLKPAAVSGLIGAAILSLVFFHPFSSKTPVGINPDGSNQNPPLSSLQAGMFKYHGYASDEQRTMALVNQSIYHEGDMLDEKSGYVLKSISPKHIVILNRRNQSEFTVFLQ